MSEADIIVNAGHPGQEVDLGQQELINEACRYESKLISWRFIGWGTGHNSSLKQLSGWGFLSCAAAMA